MPANLERHLTRLLLIVIGADALALATRYEGAAQASLCVLAVVAAAGLHGMIVEAKKEQDEEGRANSRARRRPPETR